MIEVPTEMVYAAAVGWNAGIVAVIAKLWHTLSYVRRELEDCKEARGWLEGFKAGLKKNDVAP